jgi:hypothetical protein
MSHDDFLLGYQTGRLGCSVSTLLTLRLFLTGRIREKRVVLRLIGWSLGLLMVVGLSILGFLYLPAVWTLLGSAFFLVVLAVGFTHTISGLIVSLAIADDQFYQLVLAERALYVSADYENNLPKRQRVVPLRHPRRAQR